MQDNINTNNNIINKIKDDVVELKIKMKSKLKIEELYDEYDIMFKKSFDNIKNNIDKLELKINEMNNDLLNQKKNLDTVKNINTKYEEDLINKEKEIEKIKQNYKNEIKKEIINEKKNKRSNRQPGVFARLRHITGKLANFIGVESGIELSGSELTKKVWQEIKKRNLCYKDDIRVLRVDKEVSELFNIPMTVNNSTKHNDPNGFNFSNLQKYIQKIL